MQKIKQIFKILLFNIIFFAFILFLSEIYFFDKYLPNYKGVSGYKLPKYSINTDQLRRYWHSDDRDFLTNSTAINKSGIVLFGCSYAYGHGLKPVNSPAAKLAKYTGRPVWTDAYIGEAPSMMYFQRVVHQEFYDKKPAPEFLIYVLMFDTIARIKPIDVNEYNVWNYKSNTNPSLNEKILNKLNNLYTIKYLRYKKVMRDYKQCIEVTKFLIVKSKELTKRHWPKSKFILLIYKDIDYKTTKTTKGLKDWQYKSLDINNWKSVENHGVILLSTEEFLPDIAHNQIYKNLNDPLKTGRILNKDEITYTGGVSHPNSYAWEKIIPLLSAKLGL